MLPDMLFERTLMLLKILNIYHEKYGDFINDVNRGGLKIPGDSFCQWTIFSYIVFHEVVNDCCRTCNLLMMMAEFYSFDA